jgi:glycosyltransferase involved in cell wall biosynthesis
VRSQLTIWVFQTGEPLHNDCDESRPMRAMNLANKLLERGHHVVLWSSAFHHQTKTHRSLIYKEVKVSNNLELRLVPSPGYKSNISVSRFYDHCVLAWNLRKCLKTCVKGPDVAFVGYPPIEAAYVMGSWLKKKKIPFLLDVKDQWPNILVASFPGPLRFLARILLAPYYVVGKKSMLDATGICTHTPGFLNWSLAFSKRNLSNNDVIAPLTAPNDVIDAESMNRAQDWWLGQGFFKTPMLRVVFVGSFSRAFDFDTIFSAASELKAKNVACEFVLCGDGDKAHELRSIAEDHDNVRVVGWIDRPKIKALSLISNVTIAPYKSTSDFMISVPNKIIDSLMLGLPILSPLKGEVGKLIADKNVGFTYGDSLELVSYISALIADSGLQENMSNNAKNLYESAFEFDNAYGGLVEHIENLKTYE